jgi:VWFA-related protein
VRLDDGLHGFARRLASSVALAGIALFAQQSPPPAGAPQQPPVFRGEANLVLVDAYPQRDGKIIEGLTTADFEIYEDGKLQAIRNLEFVRIEGNEPETARRDPNNVPEMIAMAADPHNRVFVAYLDTMQTTVEGSQRIRAPLVQTLNRLIGPEDLFGVMTPLMRPRDIALARRMLSTEDQLSRYWSWGERNGVVAADKTELVLSACFEYRDDGTGRLVPWTVRGDNRLLDKILIERLREDRALQGLEDLVPHLGSLREARSVVLLITDGFLLLGQNRALTEEPARDARMVRAKPIPAMGLADGDYGSCVAELNRLALLDNRRRYLDLIAAAQRANVSFYPVAPNGLAVFDVGAASERSGTETSLADNYAHLRDRVQSLTTLAENTGGIATVNRNDVAQGLRKVIDDLSAYYLLGYYSSNENRDGRFRKIEVKLKQPGITVHARRGYVAQPAVTAAAVPATGTRAAAAAPPAGVADALSALAKVRPEADLYASGALLSPSELRVVVELASRHVDTAAWRGGGTVTVEVRSASGERLTSAKGTIDAGARAVVLAIPVTSSGPLTIRTSASARDAILDADPITLRAASGVLGVPSVFRAAASPRAPLKPMADLQLRRTERIHVEWPISGPTDTRSVRLLTKLAQPITADIGLTERTVDGKPQLAVDLGLAAFGEGEYILEVQATIGGTTDRQWLGFRVVR